MYLKNRGRSRGKLFARRRGVYHVAREEARHREDPGRYIPGDFADAEEPVTEPADSDPCCLCKCFMKTRGAYDLAEAECTAIRGVREINPGWSPEEPRPHVVLGEWRLPNDIYSYSHEYYYRFRFPMTTRDDLILDAVPMVWGTESGIVHKERVESPCCGCVDPRPPPLVNVRHIFILNPILRDRQKDRPWHVRAEESNDSRFRLFGLSRIQQVNKVREDSPRGTTVAHLHVVFPGQRCPLL
ncbi:hypothetical protein TNCT_716471 [Trichonephila clavata]|uniref:Uncharacterized protein n=1 Tax=Trichonephila clavata TaxID=2740835 RepID=A0A8X6GYK2_TRICU|nr:hypothetical protein TNCT_716471 [Trichonephila clavata]